MTDFKEIQIVHAGPLAETQVYVVEGWVTGEAILSGDPRGVVCLCLMPEMAPRLVAALDEQKFETTLGVASDIKHLAAAVTELCAHIGRRQPAAETAFQIEVVARQIARCAEDLEGIVGD